MRIAQTHWVVFTNHCFGFLNINFSLYPEVGVSHSHLRTKNQFEIRFCNDNVESEGKDNKQLAYFAAETLPKNFTKHSV